MQDLIITRRNSRYRGVIESLKYNNIFNEKKLNIVRSEDNYLEEILPLISELEQEINKNQNLKNRLFSYLATKEYYKNRGK